MKLAFLLGLVLVEGVMLAIVASLAVLPAALVLHARHGAAAMRMGVPFGPFLSLGALVALLVG